MKHQSDNMILKLGSFRSRFRIHGLNFEIILNGLSSLYNCLQMTITSSFQFRFAHNLNHWTTNFPSFEMIYNMPKKDIRKCSKFHLKIRVHVVVRFWDPNFPVNLIEFASIVGCPLSHSTTSIASISCPWLTHFNLS